MYFLFYAGKDFGIDHFGTFVVNTFRIEKGFKMWGNEMNCDGSILEAGLEGFVRWSEVNHLSHSLKSNLIKLTGVVLILPHERGRTTAVSIGSNN